MKNEQEYYKNNDWIGGLLILVKECGKDGNDI